MLHSNPGFHIPKPAQRPGSAADFSSLKLSAPALVRRPAVDADAADNAPSNARTKHLGQHEVALTLATYGGGSMLAALIVPRLLERASDRTTMVAAAGLLTIALGAMTGLFASGAFLWAVVLGGWFVLGIAYSMSVTPSGRLLRRSANADDRPAVFAAQFALSQGCRLIAYPVAGQVGAMMGQTAAFATMAGLAGIGTLSALALWPARDSDLIAHSHDDLPADHPHLVKDHKADTGHALVIDDLHNAWPRAA